MKVVIFGCDNTGKSTLGKYLAEYFEGKCVHSPGVVPLEQMKEFMETNLNSDEVIFFDRFPIIEEKVYGPLLRGDNQFKEDEYNKSLLDKVDLFIYCNPKFFSILNWGTRDQYPGIKENVLEIIKQYNLMAFSLRYKGYNVVEYNYDFQHPDEMVFQIRKVCE